jgi:hypothetical protein
MQTRANPLKVPFGTAKGVRLRNMRFLQWEDAFDVDFEDGVSFLEPHATIRKANKIALSASVKSVELDTELYHGFFVHYPLLPDTRRPCRICRIQAWKLCLRLVWGDPFGNEPSLLSDQRACFRGLRQPAPLPLFPTTFRFSIPRE